MVTLCYSLVRIVSYHLHLLRQQLLIWLNVRQTNGFLPRNLQVERRINLPHKQILTQMIHQKVAETPTLTITPVTQAMNRPILLKDSLLKESKVRPKLNFLAPVQGAMKGNFIKHAMTCYMLAK